MTARAKFPIVGIGASAGGIPAMEGFFHGVAPKSGMAFVVATHLSPERESLLHEVISRYTDMPVVVASDGLAIEIDHVYVMPQAVILTVEEGRLRLRRPSAIGRERKPIDIFLVSLAEDQGEYAVAVILSGGDSDGSLGVKAIKERGGLTIAQVTDGSAPRNPDMPDSAIATGLIDIAVSAEHMGERLLAYARGFDTLAELVDDDGVETRDLGRVRERVYAILRSHSGHDFSGYKAKTFLRRVKRRMQLAQVSTVDAYIELLSRNSDEVMNLFRDLLINVTTFFRDTDAFAELEEKIIPQLFEGKIATDSVRVWVPGCATGEEVYSLGILMRERMEKLFAVPRVQIFATDIDEHALGVARAARYPEALLEGVSAERRQRFFARDGESFVLSNDVRELCIFSPHSLIRDPPFSRMDMVSCRNLLIYFGSDIQNRVIPLFHYSLKPGGYLFLGTSESIGQHTDLFSPVEKKQRIFQAREHAGPRRLDALIGEPRASIFPLDPAIAKPGAGAYPLRQAVDTHVLERFAPPHVVVNGEGDVVYYSTRTGDYLEQAQGAPSRQLVTMARKGLRLDLRAALREAAATRRTVVHENIAVEDEGEQVQHITLTVEPLIYRGNGEPLYVVIFEPSGALELLPGPVRGSGIDDLADLERELRDTRERLQSTIEEYETALEEVKSSNEELVSVNEEAQSTNEELEASKEEMQSLNEELNTINAELGVKIEELDHANNDLKNLFESTEIATVFLDRGLVVRNFTPAASSFFNLRASDIGRPLTDLSSQLDYPEMKAHIADVFSSGEALTHHLARDVEGRFYLVRLIPYRDKGGRIQGVVVTLVDVSIIARAEEHQKVLVQELNHRVKNMLAVVLSIAVRTGDSASTKADYVEALTGRLQAMARAFTLLSQESWTEISIGALIRQELEPFAAGQISSSGPEVKLKPEGGLSIGMVIHELATNATKYGALSVSSGRIEVTWSHDPQGVTIDWRESGGPKVGKPTSSGFGLSLIEGEIGYRLQGTVEANFKPTGLSMRISFPLATTVKHE